jgi:DNA (cytosine-5)-methyltransferase 1
MMRVVSLFSGAGGLDLGFIKAGAKIVFANDIDSDHVETYKRNIGDFIIRDDVANINPKDIPDADIVIGGFPCLGFTIAKGKFRRVDNKYNFLYKYFLKIVEVKRPNYFLIENVPGMMRGKEFAMFFKKIIEEFKQVGYLVTYSNPPLNAANYGVPQIRKRIIILGTRNFLEKRLDSFPPPTHNQKNWVTIKEAIGDLPLEENLNIPNHVACKHKVTINGYLGNRPLYWDKPSPTIMGRGSRTGGPVIHPHPNAHRRLTVRECARLQSFPDDFIFYSPRRKKGKEILHGSISSEYAQVGDAVPPLFAFRLAQHVMRLAGFSPKEFNPREWELPWLKKGYLE